MRLSEFQYQTMIDEMMALWEYINGQQLNDCNMSLIQDLLLKLLLYAAMFFPTGFIDWLLGLKHLAKTKSVIQCKLSLSIRKMCQSSGKCCWF